MRLGVAWEHLLEKRAAGKTVLKIGKKTVGIPSWGQTAKGLFGFGKKYVRGGPRQRAAAKRGAGRMLKRVVTTRALANISEMATNPKARKQMELVQKLTGK